MDPVYCFPYFIGESKKKKKKKKRILSFFDEPKVKNITEMFTYHILKEYRTIQRYAKCIGIQTIGINKLDERRFDVIKKGCFDGRKHCDGAGFSLQPEKFC